MSSGELLPLPLAGMDTQLKNKDFNVKSLWKQQPKKKWGLQGKKQEKVTGFTPHLFPTG